MILPWFVIVFIRYLTPKALLNNYYLSSSSSEKEEELVCIQKKERDEEKEQGIIDDDDDDDAAAAAVAANYILSKLDSDMFSEIITRLGLSDHARFRAVCKTWLLAAAPPQPLINNNNNNMNIYTQRKSLLPWYVHCNRLLPTVSNTLELRIYDPSSSWSSLHIISLAKLEIPSPPSYSGVGMNCHKNWLMLNITNPRSLEEKMERYIFLYSYITKRLIKLPRFDFRPGFSFRRRFTTHDPDSPTCVFVLLNGPITDRFVIVTCRKGDTEWTVREFPNTGHDAFLPSYCIPLFFRGMLYIVSPYGQLASYNIADGEFRFVSLGVDHLFTLNYNNEKRRRIIFELNGELMILNFVPWIEENTTSSTFPANQFIKQFDWSNMVWIPVSSLGGKTLFVSNKIYPVAEINTEQIMRSDGLILSNKIYHFIDDWCIIYSLDDNGELVKFKSINLLEGGGGDLIAYRDNNTGIDLEGRSDTYRHGYLEPPVVVH